MSSTERHCQQCGRVRAKGSKRELCRFCQIVQRRAARICPTCHGAKAEKASECRNCYVATREDGGSARSWDWRLNAFDPQRFTALLEYTGWTPKALATEARISIDTIWKWQAGRRKPRREEFELVARVLSMTPCSGCGGTGWSDPSQRRVDGIIAASSSLRSIKGRLQRQDEAQITVGRLRIDPTAYAVRLDGQMVRLTGREIQILLVLAEANGRSVLGQIVGDTIWPGNRNGSNIVRTNVYRLRQRLALINAGSYVETCPDYGYRLSADCERGDVQVRRLA